MEIKNTFKNSGVDKKSKSEYIKQSKNLLRYIPVLLITLVLLSSCEKYYDKTYEDYDLVQLKFNTEIDFTAYKTYSLADTLNIVRDTVYNGENGYPDFNIEMDENTDGEYSRSVIMAVKSKLDALGLEEVKETDGVYPDLRVVISSMTLKQVSRFIYYPNGNYNSWWGSGSWSNYYTWGVYSYHSSNNGSLSIDMLDLTNPVKLAPKMTQVNSIWRGSYEGLVGPTYEDYTDRVLEGVEEIFVNDTAFN